MVTAPRSRHVTFVSRVLLQRFKPPSVISKLYKISVRIHDPENQAQWFAKIRTTGTSCCRTPIVYRGSQYLADYGRLVVGWYSPVFEPSFPANELSLFEYVRLVQCNRETSKSPRVFRC